MRLAAIAPGREATHAVPVALDVEFNGLGDSPRAIASGADGYFIATLGKGRVDFSSQGLLMDKLPGGSFLIRLFDTLNPAVELKSHTTLKCAVVVAVIEDGVVEVDPTVARSYDLRVSGRGWIDLETEELDFQWATKPRRLTTSLVSVTDNFVKLGGTLTEPEIQAKPLEAMTATGVGVATAGASLVALSLWKSAKTWRLCRKARKVARKEHKARQLRHPG